MIDGNSQHMKGSDMEVSFHLIGEDQSIALSVAAQEKLFQIHYWPENYEERDEFKEKTGMRSQMVSQRAISGDDVYSQLTEWYLSVLDSPKVPSGMELFFVKDDSELFWKTESKAE